MSSRDRECVSLVDAGSGSRRRRDRRHGAAAAFALALLVACAGARTAAAQAYSLELMQATGGSFTALHSRVSINDADEIAFVGTQAGAQSVHVIDTIGSPTSISFASGRTYLGVSLNNQSPAQAVSRDQFITQYFVRRWPDDGSLGFTIVGRSGPLFDSALGFLDINDSGVVAFTALKTSPTTQSIIYGASSEPPRELARYNGNISPKPVISNDNQVVFRDNLGRLVSVAHPSGAVTVIASASDGFNLSQMGDRPGISASGDVIAFRGDTGSGSGVYLSVREPVGGTRRIFRVAGTPDFSFIPGVGHRTCVISSGSLLGTLTTTTVYFGTRGGVSGIYRTSNDFRMNAGVTELLDTRTSLVTPVGAVVEGREIASLEVSDSLNDSEVVAFFASFTDGTQGIVRGTPGAQDSVEILGYHYVDGDGNDRFAQPLDDFSMLTPAEVIVVKAVTTDPDPAVRDVIELEFFSDSDPTPRTLFATESGPSTGTFYNYNPADGDSPDFPQPLRLDLASGPDSVAVLDEGESITVRLASDPAISDSAILDLAETGVGWVEDYGDPLRILGNSGDKCPTLTNLTRAPENGNAFHDKLTIRDWIGAFRNADLDCRAEQFESDSDSNEQGIDTVDIGAWIGHGPPQRLHLFTEPHVDAGNCLGDDMDRDGIVNACDNCPRRANVDQFDTDGDGMGNACDRCARGDDDDDSDGVADACDNCPVGPSNPDQADADADGTGDACDSCPGCPYTPPPEQDAEDVKLAETQWGDDDLDWMLLFTCNFLAEHDTTSRACGSGVRMVCGFTNQMRILPSAWLAGSFIDMVTDPINPRSIKDAWMTMSAYEDVDPATGRRRPQNDQNGIGACMFDSSAADDHLPGHGDYVRAGFFAFDDSEVEDQP